MTNNDILQLAMRHTGKILARNFQLDVFGHQGGAGAAHKELDANSRAYQGALRYFGRLMVPGARS